MILLVLSCGGSIHFIENLKDFRLRFFTVLDLDFRYNIFLFLKNVIHHNIRSK